MILFSIVIVILFISYILWNISCTKGDFPLKAKDLKGLGYPKSKFSARYRSEKSWWDKNRAFVKVFCYNKYLVITYHGNAQKHKYDLEKMEVKYDFGETTLHIKTNDGTVILYINNQQADIINNLIYDNAKPADQG